MSCPECFDKKKYKVIRDDLDNFQNDYDGWYIETRVCMTCVVTPPKVSLDTPMETTGLLTSRCPLNSSHWLSIVPSLQGNCTRSLMGNIGAKCNKPARVFCGSLDHRRVVWRCDAHHKEDADGRKT